MRRALAVLAAALALAAVAAPPAGAHALLEGSSPERGATLERAPGRVVLRFSEPVEVAFGAVRVFDAQGRQVERGRAVPPGRSTGSAVAVACRTACRDGGYTATYRVDLGRLAIPSRAASCSPSGPARRRAADRRRAARRPGRRPGDVRRLRRRARRRVRRDRRRHRRARACCCSSGCPALRAAVDVRAGRGLGAWEAASAAFARRLRVVCSSRRASAGAPRPRLAALVAAGRDGRRARRCGPRWATSARCSRRASALVWGLGVLAWLAVIALAAARPARRCRRCGRRRSAPTGVALPGARPGDRRARRAARRPRLPAGARRPRRRAVAGRGAAAGQRRCTSSPRAPGSAASSCSCAALPAATRRARARGAHAPAARASCRASRRSRSPPWSRCWSAGSSSRVLMLTPSTTWSTRAFGRAILVKVGARRRAPRRRRAAPPAHPARARPRRGGGRAAGPRPACCCAALLRFEVALGVAALAATGALAGYAPADGVAAGPVLRLGGARARRAPS